jgi:Ser/Thr protein kinase RdoA (MazF antagonist)
VLYFFNTLLKGYKEMDEQTFFTDMLTALYGLSPSRLESLNTSCLEDGRIVYHLYRVEQHAGPTQILFAYHDDVIAAPTYRWGRNQPLDVWLRQRAGLLTYLAEQYYLAPRVLPSQAGAPVVRVQPWNFLVTSYIGGDANVLSPENMVWLGSALGQLHRIQLPDQEQIGPAWWNETYSLPHALEQLTAAASVVPPDYQDFYEQMRATLQAIQHHLSTVPRVILHGDCWAPNAVTQERKVVLIDWECAGQGAAILDLGTLLLRCQYDQYGDIPEVLQAQHVTSVIGGYVQHRIPTPEELDMLLEAMRFSIVWGGAWIVSRTLKEGWTPRVERLLARIQRGYRLAESTARLARREFERMKTGRP